MGDLDTVDDFERWYRAEHGRLVAALTVSSGSPEIAQDVASEAFARALERWDRVARMESPTGWVRQVAVNLLRRRFRRAALERQLLRRSAPRADAVPAPELDPALWSAVLDLPPRQRAVLGLRVVLDHSQDDTARLLGIRPATVSAALGHARKNLERALGDTTTEVEHA